MEVNLLSGGIGGCLSKNLKKIIAIGAAVLVVIITIVIIVAVSSSGSSNNKKDNPPAPVPEPEPEPEPEPKPEPEPTPTSEVSICGYDSKGNLKHNCDCGYIYHDEDTEKTVAFILKRNWNCVFYSYNFKKRPEIIKSTYKKLKEKGIYFHAMTLEDPGFILDEGDSTKYEGYGAVTSGVDYIKKLLDFNTQNNITLDGIHLDVEVHQIGDLWDWNSDGKKAGWNEKLMLRYVDLCKQTRALLKTRGLTNILLSAALSFKYEDMVKKGFLKTGKATELVNENGLQMAIPMIYEGSHGKTPEDVEIKMSVFSDYVWTVAGMGITMYPDEAAIKESIKKINTDCAKNSNFFGTCIYQNVDYPDW